MLCTGGSGVPPPGTEKGHSRQGRKELGKMNFARTSPNKRGKKEAGLALEVHHTASQTPSYLSLYIPSSVNMRVCVRLSWWLVLARLKDTSERACPLDPTSQRSIIAMMTMMDGRVCLPSHNNPPLTHALPLHTHKHRQRFPQRPAARRLIKTAGSSLPILAQQPPLPWCLVVLPSLPSSPFTCHGTTSDLRPRPPRGTHRQLAERSGAAGECGAELVRKGERRRKG
jgi:hypothetical protein